MSVFAKAIEDGFTAAHDAEIAQKEINAVFIEMSKHVRAKTNDKVSIARVGPIKFKKSNVAIADGQIVAIKNATLNAASPERRRLADFEMDSAGYPFKITWDRITQFCEDRKSLELCLAELLRDPSVGRAILSLKNR